MCSMNIAHLTVHHHSLDHRIFDKECRTLSMLGHQVHILAPGGSPGNNEGVFVHRLNDHSDRRNPRRLISRMVEAFLRSRQLKADVYHIHDPLLIPVAVALKNKDNRVFYDVHEESAEEARALHSSSRTRAELYSMTWKIFESVGRRYIDGFICATPAIAALFPLERTVVVRNYPRIDTVSKGNIPYSDRRPTLLYAGGISRIRGAYEMVKALETIPNNLDVHLRLIGDPDDTNLIQKLRSLAGWKKVHWNGRIPHSEVLNNLNRSRIGLALLHPLEIFKRSLPVKLFEYMASGIPVIASNFPMWRDIISNAQCGIVVDPLDVDAISSAIRDLLEDPQRAEAMGNAGKQAVLNKYNWEKEELALRRIYDRK